MTPQLRLQKTQIDGFREVLSLGDDVLIRLAEDTENPPKLPLRPANYFAIVEKIFGENDAVAQFLAQEILSFGSLMRQAGITAEEATAGLTFGLENHEAPLSAAELEHWNQSVRPVWLRILGSTAITILSKAIDLSYEYANLYRRGRILTDIRPLFNGDHENEPLEIKGAVVSYTLRLRYESIDGDHELSIAMDERDIDELIRQCHRAKIKAKTAQMLMQTQANIPTTIPRGAGDE